MPVDTSPATVTEAQIILADNTTANSSTTKHGLLIKLDNTVTNFLNGTGAWSVASGTGASTADAFVTIGAPADLTGERALTGTANQVVVTDNGANTTVVLSTPQDIATASTPQFARLGIGIAADSNQILLLSQLSGTDCLTIKNSQTAGNRRWTWYPATNGTDTNIEVYEYSGTGGVRIVWGTGGAVQFTKFGAGAATFDASGNISSVSDERLKDIQGPFTEGLAQVLQLNPINYKYKPESKLDTENIYSGFSAQQVMKYIPEAVCKNKEGYYTFSDRPVIAALVNSVKELQKEIDDLRQELGKEKINIEKKEYKNEEKILISKADTPRQR